MPWNVRSGLRRLAFGAALLAAVAVRLAAAEGVEPARPLTERGLENLTAFARLYGYVRWFHPSDEAAGADWDGLALAGAQAAEGAESPAALARALESFFQPVAPTLRVFPTGGPRPPVPEELAPPPGSAPKVTAWRNQGVHLSEGESIYRNERVDNRSGGRRPDTFGTALQILDATPYRGRKIRLRAAVRAEVEGANQAQMWLRVDRPNRERGFFDNMGDRPIRSADWQVYTIEGEVAEDAERIALGMILQYAGKVWVDDATLETVGGDDDAAPGLTNGGFEEAAEDGGPRGWMLPPPVRAAGFELTATDQGAHAGERAALLAYAPKELPEPPELPDPREPFAADLGGGVSALLPLSLFVDAQGTRPEVPAGVEPPKPAKPEGFTPTGDDRATRLAGVVIAWNVFQHFYPYFDVVETDWPGALREALRAAATDPDRRAYLDTLNRLVARLHDGHGAVWHPEMAWKHRLPLAWDWVEGELAVTHVEPEAAEAGLVRGDVVLSIDGRPLAELVAATEPLLAAATPQHRKVRLRRRLAMSREPGEALLAVRHPDGRTATVRLPRVRVPETFGNEEPRPETVEEIRPGIFYVDMNRIDDAGFREAVGRLAEARGVIFDLRGYPNLSTVILAHLTDRTVQSARWNVPVFTRPDREGVTFEVSGWPVEPAEPRIRGKAAFLTDGRAISYAETYLGIVEHYRLAEIVGGPTAGTNGNVSPFKLPGGYNLSWTGMKVLKHDGSRHHGVGIKPTVPVSRTLGGVAEGRDEVLEKAIEVVSREE
jgi:C-terminal processing protease CtpA/Prc